jgi:hypothetical protein
MARALFPVLLGLSFAGPAKAQDPETVTPDAATTLHHIKTVFLIVMENQNWTGDGGLNIKGNTEGPYINYTLLPMGVLCAELQQSIW